MLASSVVDSPHPRRRWLRRAPLALLAAVLVLTGAMVITLRVAFSGPALASRVCARLNADMRGRVAIPIDRAATQHELHVASSIEVRQLAQADTTVVFGADVALARGEQIRIDGTLRDYWPTDHFGRDSRLAVVVTGLRRTLALSPPLDIAVGPVVATHDGAAPTWMTGVVAIDGASRSSACASTRARSSRRPSRVSATARTPTTRGSSWG